MSNTNLIITNVHLASESAAADTLWTIECANGKVVKIIAYDPAETHSAAHGKNVIDGKGTSILLPSLCHAHIHLDKCFILDRCGELISGDLREAMEVTAKAKAGFPLDSEDLLKRGRKLIRESVECGVTSMRAHVEIDTLAGVSALDAGLLLKKECEVACYIQVSAFAQEALFTNANETDPGPNYTLLAEALHRPGIEVVGSAPYVEPSLSQAKQNIALIFNLATQHHLHVDFHLDFNLDPTSEPLIYEVIRQASLHCPLWSSEPKRRITIGHATRLQLFTPEEWRHLSAAIGDLPITLVSLPNTDIYMQGRAHTHEPLGAPRGALRVPYLARQYGVKIAMSVNNVGNAFTPQGSVDPLALCTFGAAVFQAATKMDVQSLMESVTITSKLAIGDANSPVDVSNSSSTSSSTSGLSSLVPQEGDPADFVLLHGTKTLGQAVLNPGYDRTTIRRGVVVARRRTRTWGVLAESGAESMEGDVEVNGDGDDGDVDVA
ncbi:hypothetical protein BDP27DRAFT_1441696 [Rhodocollybia butyracea]|uniref:Metallo-dependent hydrolase n=1 Tax=Rhodocollybia butyracea TaxID=206335 RepID=A0A9P5UFU4_9AGAR|nr:hypothetical protein BDP27DRAFT_1441696 [Rhodocollybia butyracea]